MVAIDRALAWLDRRASPRGRLLVAIAGLVLLALGLFSLELLPPPRRAPLQGLDAVTGWVGEAFAALVAAGWLGAPAARVLGFLLVLLLLAGLVLGLRLLLDGAGVRTVMLLFGAHLALGMWVIGSYLTEVYERPGLAWAMVAAPPAEGGPAGATRLAIAGGPAPGLALGLRLAGFLTLEALTLAGAYVACRRQGRGAFIAAGFAFLIGAGLGPPLSRFTRQLPLAPRPPLPATEAAAPAVPGHAQAAPPLGSAR